MRLQNFFMDVIKWLGSMHDTRMFANSDIKKASGRNYSTLSKGNCWWGRQCSNLKPGWPSLSLAMKEYTGGRNKIKDQFFCHKLSSARMTIECVFGHLRTCLHEKVKLVWNFTLVWLWAREPNLRCLHMKFREIRFRGEIPYFSVSNSRMTFKCLP